MTVKCCNGAKHKVHICWCYAKWISLTAACSTCSWTCIFFRDSIILTVVAATKGKRLFNVWQMLIIHMDHHSCTSLFQHSKNEPWWKRPQNSIEIEIECDNASTETHRFSSDFHFPFVCCWLYCLFTLFYDNIHKHLCLLSQNIPCVFGRLKCKKNALPWNAFV